MPTKAPLCALNWGWSALSRTLAHLPRAACCFSVLGRCADFPLAANGTHSERGLAIREIALWRMGCYKEGLNQSSPSS